MLNEGRNVEIDLAVDVMPRVGHGDVHEWENVEAGDLATERRIAHFAEISASFFPSGFISINAWIRNHPIRIHPEPA